MSTTMSLKDIIAPAHLSTVARLVENRLWVALRSYLNREGVVVSDKVLPDFLYYALFAQFNKPIEHPCCFCGNDYGQWGNNPFPLVPPSDHKSRCCDDCNMDKVIPARVMCAQPDLDLKSPEDAHAFVMAFKNAENAEKALEVVALYATKKTKASIAKYEAEHGHK